MSPRRLAAATALFALTLAGCGGGTEAADEQRITNGEPRNIHYWDATRSADGTRLLFHSGLNTGGEVLIQNLQAETASATPEVVVPDVAARSPVFLPDGRVAFIEVESVTKQRLVIAAADRSELEPVATASEPSDLTVTPDGEWLLYTALREGGGGAVRRIRPDGTGDTEVFTDSLWMGTLAVSPDGRRLAYDRDDLTGPFDAEIWTARIDGSGRKKIALGNWPIWSPDGTRLAFIAPAGEREDGLPLVQVFVVPAEGGTPTEVTTSDWDKRGPLLWLDDDRIVYLYGSATEDYGQLFAVAAPAV
jgi:dipeptidyl aminopeptidase/acylaminoacyl peptidase